MRHKSFSLLEGHIATDEECLKLLESEGNGSARATATTRPARLRSGKHNMAKGAQRPEDAAVSVFLQLVSSHLICEGRKASGCFGEGCERKELGWIVVLNDDNIPVMVLNCICIRFYQ
jgi:hypothetical protein